MTFEGLVQRTREACETRLAQPDLAPLDRPLLSIGLNPGACWHAAQAISETTPNHPILQRAKQTLIPSSTADDDGALERWLLLHAALQALPRLQSLRVPWRVKSLFCEEYQHLATADGGALAKVRAGNARFAGLAKIATLRRFPAGQFDWEVSGVARSDVLAVSLRDLPKTLRFLGLRMGGLKPAFFSHLSPRRPNRSLLEDEANRSYFQMAKAMELQPEILGFAACSWFRSPATHAVSPHLAWMSRVFVENGGMVVEAGAADPDCGVLYRSATRRQLFESGVFKPTRGLVLWPRRAMIEWANAHPELGIADP
jgi:hypothetical protein